MTSTLLNSTSLNSPTIHKLNNGLTIIAEQMPVEAVNLNIWLNVGSILESDPINGMAHFLEHMVFKGTPNLEIGEFERLIEERGAITNAATSQEYTHYYITTAPKDFAELAPLQLDVVLNPTIAETAFEREKLVVLEEIRRSDDNPQRRTFQRLMQTCFETLPYRRPVLGPAETISQLTFQQMRDFHSSWYRPENMTAVAIGNLPTDELIDIVSSNFKPINSHLVSSVGERSNFVPEANFSEVVRREYVDEQLQQARLILFWRVPGMEDLAQTYPLDVLAAILGQGKVSRLFRDLREERGLVTSIGASNMTQGVQGIFYISAQLPAENIKIVEEAILEHIKKIQNESVPASDLARVCTQVANRFIFSNERPSDRANLYGYYYSQLQDLSVALHYPDLIQSLKIQDLQSAALKYFDLHAYGVIAILPK
jgi:predicted Zn-dependent peptidase